MNTNHHLGLSTGSQSLDLLRSKDGRPSYSSYRLQYDLARLVEDSPRGIQVITNNLDVSRLCLVLEPQEGHLEGCRIHLSVAVPVNWPCVPLSAKIDTPFPHPNVFDGYICCRVLHCPGFQSPSQDINYSPAYSLAGTFVQLASLFSGSSDDYDHDGNEDMALDARDSLIQAGDRFHCGFCNWKSRPGSMSPGHNIPWKHGRDVERASRRVSILNELDDKVLLVLISHLDAPSLLIFGSVYNRVKKLMQTDKKIVRREIRCFMTKRDQQDATLGIGLRFDTKCNTFVSSFDYISKFAFDELFIRKDSTNQPMELWLPLAIDDKHYAKASSDVRRCLAALEAEANDKSEFPPYRGRIGVLQDPVRHLISMANAVVEDFGNTCDDAELSQPTSLESSKSISSLAGAAERAIAGYCSIIHLIASYALENPEVISDALSTVRSFIELQGRQETRIKDGRHMSVIPVMGRFIVLLCLVDEHSWSDVQASVLQESFVRFVRLQLGDAKLPGLMYLEDDAICEWRLTQTFKACRTELRLFILQTFFLEKIAKREGMGLLNVRDELSSRLGVAPPGLATELLDRVQTIYKIDSLETFANESGWNTTREGLTTYLRERMVESGDAGYHLTHSDWPEDILAFRARDDPDFREKLIASGISVVPAAANSRLRVIGSSGWEHGARMGHYNNRRKRARDAKKSDDDNTSKAEGNASDESSGVKRSRL